MRPFRRRPRDFFVAVEGVVRWASSELLDEIVAQLTLVWNVHHRGRLGLTGEPES